MSSLTSLAEEILAKVKAIDAQLEANKLSPTSFGRDTITELPAKVQGLRFAATHALKLLARGLVMSIMDIAFNARLPLPILKHHNDLPLQWTDALSVRVVYHFKLAYTVPPRWLRHLRLRDDLFVFHFIHATISNHIATKDSSGRIRHTAVSKLLATHQGFADAVGLETEELSPAGIRVIDTWERQGQDTSVPNQSADSLHNGVDMLILRVLAQQPERERCFGGEMHFFTSNDNWDIRHILGAFN
jgi:hypothetical protein